MNKAMMIFLGLSTAVTAQAMSSHTPVPPPPIEAPAGYEWVLNKTFSDEFNGKKLDSKKWDSRYKGWEGRVPGKFVPSSISVKDGFLRMKSTVLDPAQGENKEWTIACAAVQSKTQTASYGYYEARIKPSKISTSSTFWLKNENVDNIRPFKQTELDILECIGNAKRWAKFGNHMMSNTHIEYFSENRDEEPVVLKLGKDVKLDSEVSDKFRTFGCWWVDANTMHFYLDGKLVYTITPSTEREEKPFDQTLFVNMVCETYAWEVAPTVEELMDDSINTTLYDYVRAYTLVKIK